MLSIATPIYDTLAITKKCLEAVRENTDVPYEHILVYNHPPYLGVGEYLRKQDDVRILDFGENIGCHESVNRAFEVANYDYLCKLDNDTIVPKNWASKMIEALEKIPELGFISSYLNKDLQKWKRERKIINGIEIEVCPNNMVTLSCAIFRREIWERVGPLKSIRGRVYYGGEEDNLFYLCKELGILNAHLPSVVCKHLARTEDSDPSYGDWKLAYCAGKTSLPFDVWKRSR